MPHEEASRRVYAHGLESRLAAELRAALEPKGIELVAFGDMLELIGQAGRVAPDVVMLDLGGVSREAPLAGVIAKLNEAMGRRPKVIGLASKAHGGGTLEQRLEAMRAGVDTCWIMPSAVRRLASRVLRLCGVIEAGRYRVLLVPSDRDDGHKAAATLSRIGVKTLVVEDAMKTLDRLLAFRPNLILLDLHPPAVSGVELAAIIRDHDELQGVPILFLAEDQDSDRQLAALKAGGDGFITKPLHHGDLVAAVEYRIRLSRWLQDRRALVNRRESAFGFLPRDVFVRHLERVIGAGAAAAEGRGLLLIELDQYQDLLDRLGLSASEKLLRVVESRIGRLVASDECATRLAEGRYGVLARRDGAVGLEALAGAIREQLAVLKPVDQDAKEFTVMVSIGIAPLDPMPADGGALIVRGEEALAGARRAGGKWIRLWVPPLLANGGAETQSVIKRLVTTALAQDGLLLLFQPIVSRNRHDEAFYEAQIRLRTLDGEQIPPADFLSVAERAELMPRVDRWVLRRALEAMRAKRSAYPDLKLLVHQNIATLLAPDWFKWLCAQMARDDLDRIHPWLQFQMADIRDHGADCKGLVERLRSNGIEVCAGNVTGSRDELSLLSRLGVPLAKLSLQLTRQLDQARLNEVILALQARGLAVIAPGIDDQAILSRVWACRPDFIQGGYVGALGPDLTHDFQWGAHDG